MNLYEICPQIWSYAMAKENHSKIYTDWVIKTVLLVSRISLEDFLSVTMEKMGKTMFG